MRVFIHTSPCSDFEGAQNQATVTGWGRGGQSASTLTLLGPQSKAASAPAAVSSSRWAALRCASTERGWTRERGIGLGWEPAPCSLVNVGTILPETWR